MNAFSGITARLEESYDTKFEFAMPHLFLPVALSWVPTTQSIIRRASLGNGMTIPSWSWAGWMGPVKYPVVRSKNGYGCDLMSHALLENEDRTFKCIDDSLCAEGDRLSSGYEPYDSQLRGVPHTLHFSAYSIDSEHFPIIGDNIHELQSLLGKPCGILAHAPSITPAHGKRMFVQLFTSDQSSEVWALTSSEAGFRTPITGSNYFVAALLIEWNGDIAERIGLAFILPEAWNRASLEERYIRLG